MADATARRRLWRALHAAYGCTNTTDAACNPCAWPGSGEWARRNGWGPGTVLEGDEGYGPARITLLYIGEETVLAREHKKSREGVWDLGCRLWREIKEEVVTDA